MIEDVRSPYDDISELKKRIDTLEFAVKGLADKINEIIAEVNELEGE